MGKTVDGDEKPALQVIVLGSGGGPIESNTTAFLVRSTAVGWKRGSLLAVDAGVHLAAITKILETHKSDRSKNGRQTPVTLINGPFEGLEIPHTSAKANAGHITRTLVDTYLITHPHIDHISGFVIGTASLPGARPKRLAALPSTIDAFRNHIFNNVIWPNLSDENNGAGLVTYMRLVEGGSPAVGNGDSRGYVEVCEGLGVKTWSVSHGHCIENHSHRGLSVSTGSCSSPRMSAAAPFQKHRSNSNSSFQLPNEQKRAESYSYDRICVYDSAAYFIRDIATGQEVLMFGDVEPDAISLSPRNRHIWSEAAPKIVSGQLRGIFIECSYDDSQSDDMLFGHMAPRFLIQELKVLASEVQVSKEKEIDSKKRKCVSNGNGVEVPLRRSPRGHVVPSSPVSPFTEFPPTRGFDTTQVQRIREENEPLASYHTVLPSLDLGDLPLKGVKVIIIHVKEKLDDDPPVSQSILRQMKEYENEARLGCEFVISHAGQAVYF